jgi:hypothetical protein
MRPFTRLLLAVLILALGLPALAQAGWLDGLTRRDKSEQTTAPAPEPAAAAEPVPEAPAAVTSEAEPDPMLHMDKDLAREHERFSRYAQEQVVRMNANILGGRHQMHVNRGFDGLYHASYKAIDVPGIVCQVRRSESNPQYYVGNLIYTELVLESVGKNPDVCRQGPFEPVSKKSNRIIYTSKKGGGWQ